MPEEVLEETSEVITEETPEAMPEGILEETLEETPEVMPEEDPEVIPEGAATGIPITDFITDQYLRYYFSRTYYSFCLGYGTYKMCIVKNTYS